MKVLLIWEIIPEETKLYLLEGHMADLAIASAGHFIGAEENESVCKLNDELTFYDTLGHDKVHEAFKVNENIDRVVIAGFIL